MFEKKQANLTDQDQHSSHDGSNKKDATNALVGWSSDIPALSGEPVQKLEDKDITKKKKKTIQG